MSKPPKVSVIVPFFNSEKFISEAIQSVLSQTFTSWELLLVDDGSADESGKIAKRYVTNHHARIRYLEHVAHEHKGMPASRNLGISCSSGEYIAHLDSDDIWSATLLEQQVKILDRNPTVAMTFGPMKVWSEWTGSETNRTDRVQRFTFNADRIFSPPTFVPLLLSEKNDPAGYLIRRTVLEEIGCYEDGLEMCEDWALYTKIALKYDIFISSNCNYFYRQHAAQSCSALRRSGQFYAGFLPFFNWLKKYLETVRCTDPAVLRAVTKLIRRNRFNRMRESIVHITKEVFVGS
jgi:glycosyltransferase involved in cell wall biosynthesis